MNQRWYTTDVIKDYIAAQCDLTEGDTYPWQYGYAIGMLSNILNATDPEKQVRRYIEKIEGSIKEREHA